MARRALLLGLACLLCASLSAGARVGKFDESLGEETLTSGRKSTHKKNLLNDRPIIGILSQPGDPAPDGMSYIAASYIKWVEAAGARVIPIMYDLTDDEIRERFNVINGLLIPGGGAKLEPGHRFYDTADLLVGLAIEANDAGDYFPVHGTCLGMETLSIIFSKNYTLLTKFNAEDAPAPLFYTDEATNSHFIKSLPADVVYNLQNYPIAMENHMNGLSMVSYQENRPLRDFFKVLSLSLDKDGAPYVSTMEAHQYPITAVQWHPEKNAFEWSPELHIPHSPDAVRMCQEIANFFVSEARRNLHAAKEEADEDDLLIYNWVPHYTGKRTVPGFERDFVQAYFFERGTRSDKHGNTQSA